MLFATSGNSVVRVRFSFDRFCAARLQKAFHQLDLGLLRGDDGTSETLNLRPVGVLESGLSHRYGSFMMGDHELEKKHISLFRGCFLQVVYLLWTSHTWHPTLSGVAHPGHRGLAAGSWKAPYLEPALHLPDLALLGQSDVGGEGPNLLAFGLVTHDLGHLDGLGVV